MELNTMIINYLTHIIKKDYNLQHPRTKLLSANVSFLINKVWNQINSIKCEENIFPLNHKTAVSPGLLHKYTPGKLHYFILISISWTITRYLSCNLKWIFRNYNTIPKLLINVLFLQIYSFCNIQSATNKNTNNFYTAKFHSSIKKEKHKNRW